MRPASARIPPGFQLCATKFPDAGWRIREPGQAAPNLARLLDRVTLFLTLVGLTALLVGGVGIANAVRAYLAAKTATIAAMKSVGAPRRIVFATYLIQILILAALGIVIGLALGAAIPLVALPLRAGRAGADARSAFIRRRWHWRRCSGC